MKSLIYILILLIIISPVLGQIYCHDGSNWVEIGSAVNGQRLYEEQIIWNAYNSTVEVQSGNDIPLGGLFSGTSGVVFIIIIAGMFFLIVKRIILKEEN